MKTKIIDMPMGTGKTTGLINYMNSNPENKYMFITPFLDEVQRIKDACPDLDFKEPDGTFSKLSDLKALITEGSNIVSTHALFGLIDDNVKNLLYMSGYVLVLDEVLEIIEPLEISKYDIHLLLNDNIIEVLEDGKVKILKSEYKGRFKRELNLIKNQNVYLVDDTLLLCLFDYSIFDKFEDIYILTYLFDGSIMKSYFDMYNIQYEYYNIKEDEILKGKYDDLLFRTNAKNLISIYTGRLNNVGADNTSLCSNWYSNRRKDDEHRILKNNMYNYLKNMLRSTSDLAMWSTLTGKRERIKGYYAPKSYGQNCFVACNARATNNYSNKKNLIYAVNVYINPFISKYFSRNNQRLNEDKYALQQLLQWIWRSAIRNGEAINIYIPSKRMRNLLCEYLGLEQDNTRSILNRK